MHFVFIKKIPIKSENAITITHSKKLKNMCKCDEGHAVVIELAFSFEDFVKKVSHNFLNV